MITENNTDLEAKVIELRRARMSWRDIGAELGMSHEGCRKIYLRAISRYPAENLAAMRHEEGSFLDDCIHDLRELAKDASIGPRNRIEAIKIAIVASESKRKLYGSDAPIRREIPVADLASWEFAAQMELDELARELKAAQSDERATG